MGHTRPLTPRLPLHRQELAAILIAIIAESCSLGLLSLSGWFLASCALAGLAIGSTFSYLAPSGGVRTLALGRITAGYLDRVIQHHAALDRLTRTRLSLYDGLAAGAGGALRNGELLDRAIADAQLESETNIRVITPIVVTVTVTAGAIAVIATFSPSAAALLLLATAISLVVTAVTVRRQSAQESEDPSIYVRGELVTALDAWAEMAALGATRQLRERSLRLLQSQQAHREKLQRRHNRTALFLALIAAVALASIVTVLTLAGSTAPDLVFAVLLSAGILELTIVLTETSAIWPRVSRARNRIAELSGPFTDDSKQSSETSAGPRIGVHYWRTANGRDDSVDVELSSGGTLYVVGRSGTGKTTLLRAIAEDAKHRDPAISISGAPRTVFVSHDEPTFTGTITSNLRLADPTLSEQEIEQVLHELHMTGITPTTRVGVGGRKLSGGEQRRLHIARGVLAQPDLLIIDEPTVGLDNQSAHVVLEFARHRLAHATIVLALHSLAPAEPRPADRIVVLDPNSNEGVGLAYGAHSTDSHPRERGDGGDDRGRMPT